MPVRGKLVDDGLYVRGESFETATARAAAPVTAAMRYTMTVTAAKAFTCAVQVDFTAEWTHKGHKSSTAPILRFEPGYGNGYTVRGKVKDFRVAVRGAVTVHRNPPWLLPVRQVP